MAITVKKIDGKPQLNFRERIYIWEIIRGLWLTNRHFMVNLCRHILNLFGIKTRPAAVTIQYPEVHRGYHHRLRTAHYLTHRENDDGPRCVGCMMCETICPAKCIYIVPKEHPDPNVEKQAVKFTIDMGKCVYCGFCVEACPEDAIRMDSGRLDICSYTREGMIWDIDRLMANHHDPTNYKDYDKWFNEEY